MLMVDDIMRRLQNRTSSLANARRVRSFWKIPGLSKKLSETEQLILLQILFENPGIYLDEIKEKLQELSGLSVAHSTICVEVHELGLTRQKMSFIMSRRCEDK